MSDFKYDTLGGNTGGSDAENGGGGTSFVYHLIEEHRTLLIDNGGKLCRDEHNIISDYSDLSDDGCRTWVLPQSGGDNLNHFLNNIIY